MAAYSEVQQSFWQSSFHPQQDADGFIINPVLYVFFMENLGQGENNNRKRTKFISYPGLHRHTQIFLGEKQLCRLHFM